MLFDDLFCAVIECIYVANLIPVVFDICSVQFFFSFSMFYIFFSQRRASFSRKQTVESFLATMSTRPIAYWSFVRDLDIYLYSV